MGYPAEKASIPVPVQTPPPPKSRTVKCLQFLVLALGSIQIWRDLHSSPAVPEHEEVIPHFEEVLPGHEKFLLPREAEKLFLTVPNNESAIAASRLFSGKPHLAGSPQDLTTAQQFLTLLQTELGIPKPNIPPIYEAGSPESQNAILSITSPIRLPFNNKPRAWIDTYYPYLNTPVDSKLQIIDGDKVTWEADLEEVADDTDPDAGEYATAVRPWHGLSKGGDVKGRLVYVDYGQKSDFDKLVKDGVDLKGAIALVRYGANFRGLKVKAAQEAGCAGVLIYSDTRDDGDVTVENDYKPYPEGPARNPTAVQRGSVQFLSKYPGDPTTPGYPSYKNTTRTDAESIPKIPSLPISWANAQRLLKEIKGGKVKSETTIRLVNKVDNAITPIWNTMAVIPGHIRDEVVVIGNHRDAWVLGSADPTSGTAALHEVIKGFGELLRNHWKPLRTILIASWDAEEYGLIGSTEFGEDFGDWLSKYAVAYLNLDVAVKGSRFIAGGSPSLAHLIRKAAEDIPHPTEPKRSLWDARTDSGSFFGPDGQTAKIEEIQASDKTGVHPLGSGSDYTVMLQRLGIASTDEGFGSTSSDAVYHYHSVFDTHYWQQRYADPGFHRHVAVAKHIGLMTLRLTDSFVLPLNTTQYALELNEYLDKVEQLADDLKLKPDLSELRTSILRLGAASFILDVEKAAAEKELRKVLKKIHKKKDSDASSSKWRWKKFRKFVKRLFGAKTQEELILDEDTDLPKLPFPLPPIRRLIQAVKRVRDVNTKLSGFESGFISQEGIKDREWYRHLGVAPGKWLGYGATTFPALTEALQYERDADLANKEAARLVELIDKLAEKITKGLDN